MKLVCKTVFGSNLYGTATPSSDTDVRGIFIPSKRDILLGRVPKTNREQEAGKEDDYELYSLHHFVKLACEGQTVAFDILWTPSKLVELGPAGGVWEELVQLRGKFLSKRMNAFIGYARGQAAKYSLKGERLAKREAFLRALDGTYSEDVLAKVWTKLPRDDERTNVQGVAEIQICGKWFGATTQVRFVRESIESTIAAYGERAHAAAKDGGIDWKALSHAVRVSIELRDLLSAGRIDFPLQEADLLRAIKKGNHTLENVQSMLDVLLEQVEDLSSKSLLPEHVDRNYWDDWLARVTEREIL